MNFAAMSAVAMTATYRVIGSQGFHPGDFNMIRNILSMCIAFIWCVYSGNSIKKMFPWDKKGALVTRTLTGQANFVLLNMAAPLAPLALIMVFWQTNPFWISIVAFCLLKEPLVRLEIIGMFICFGAVVMIVLQQKKEKDVVEGDEAGGAIGDSLENKKLLGLMFGLFAGVVMAFCAVSTRYLKETPTPVLMVYHTIGGLTLTLIYLGIEAAFMQ